MKKISLLNFLKLTLKSNENKDADHPQDENLDVIENTLNNEKPEVSNTKSVDEKRSARDFTLQLF